MEISAKTKHLHMSSRKVGLVAALLRGLLVVEAEEQLMVVKKLAARPLYKLMASAVANAKNNFNIDKADLFIKDIKVGQGSTLQRSQPRAFGRSGRIRKRTSHICLILGVKEDKVGSIAKVGAKTKLTKPILVTDLKLAVKSMAEDKKPETGQVDQHDKKGEQSKETESRSAKTQAGGSAKNIPDKKQGQNKGFVKKMFSRKVG